MATKDPPRDDAGRFRSMEEKKASRQRNLDWNEKLRGRVKNSGEMTDRERFNQEVRRRAGREGSQQ